MENVSLPVLLVLLTVLVSAPSRAATVDGLNIHYTDTGSGPALVFVHGWTCDLSSWDKQVPAFADRYRVIALDLPGHGESDAPAREAFSLALFARAIEAVREEAGVNKIVLVGHSMGAPVIRQYAIAFPDHVAGLVAVDGPMDLRTMRSRDSLFPDNLTREAREGIIRGMFVDSTPQAVQDHVLAMMLAPSEDVAQGAIDATFDPANRTADVIDAPVMAVVAGTGTVPDLAVTREVIPAFEVHQVAGTGHFLMLEKPEAFNALLDDFLNDLRP